MTWVRTGGSPSSSTTDQPVLAGVSTIEPILRPSGGSDVQEGLFRARYGPGSAKIPVGSPPRLAALNSTTGVARVVNHAGGDRRGGPRQATPAKPPFPAA